jgi:hypothetical protein
MSIAKVFPAPRKVGQLCVKREAALAPEFAPPDPFEPVDDPTFYAVDPDVDRVLTPSLPIILFSAACGLGTGILAFYVFYRLLLLNLPLSTGIATLCLLAMLSGSAGGLSLATGSNPILNVAFGCGLILLTLVFFTFCSLIGALTATLVLTLS